MLARPSQWNGEQTEAMSKVHEKKSDRDLLAEQFSTPKALRILVVTMSDRAAAGVYEDKSGPRLRTHVEDFFSGSGIGTSIESTILTDDAEGLREALEQAKRDGVHVVFTTGGTGVGPRDNTPDVVLAMADKTIPGIMELIRMKYGADKPCALISRTVAATLGSMLVYTLPGSTKGVDEYMGEILKSIEHVICVLHGLDAH